MSGEFDQSVSFVDLSLQPELDGILRAIEPVGRPRIQRSGKRIEEGKRDAGNGFQRRTL